jgi:hypothetical protein
MRSSMLVCSKQLWLGGNRAVSVVAMSHAKLWARPNKQHKSTTSGASDNDVSRAADQKLSGSVNKLDLSGSTAAAAAWQGKPSSNR